MYVWLVFRPLVHAVTILPYPEVIFFYFDSRDRDMMMQRMPLFGFR